MVASAIAELLHEAAETHHVVYLITDGEGKLRRGQD